jgi:hypothetical protein
MRGGGSRPLPHAASEVPTLKAFLEAHPDDFFLLIGWQIPGPPFRTVIFAFQRTQPEGADPVVSRLLREFVDGTNDFRMQRFKYIPRIDLAPKAVMRGIRMIGGVKPTLLCKKLKSSFHRGPNYMEINIDIASSKIANAVTGIILPKIADVVVSHAFLLEGRSEAELPERVLGSLRTQGVNMSDNTVSFPDTEAS